MNLKTNNGIPRLSPFPHQVCVNPAGKHVKHKTFLIRAPCLAAERQRVGSAIALMLLASRVEVVRSVSGKRNRTPGLEWVLWRESLEYIHCRTETKLRRAQGKAMATVYVCLHSVTWFIADRNARNEERSDVFLYVSTAGGGVPRLIEKPTPKS